MRNNNKEINFACAQSNKMSSCLPATPHCSSAESRKITTEKSEPPARRYRKSFLSSEGFLRPFSSLNQKRFWLGKRNAVIEHRLCGARRKANERWQRETRQNPFRTSQFIFSLAIAFMINNCNNHFNKHTKCIFPNGLISIRTPAECIGQFNCSHWRRRGGRDAFNTESRPITTIISKRLFTGL
jgi:hypothetical protein